MSYANCLMPNGATWFNGSSDVYFSDVLFSIFLFRSLFLFRLFDFLCFSKSFHTSSCIEYFLLSRCYSFFKIALDHLERTGHARRVLLFDFFSPVLTAFSLFFFKEADRQEKKREMIIYSCTRTDKRWIYILY